MNTKHLLDEYIDVYMTSLKYLDSFISEPAMAFKLSFEQYLIMHTIKESQNVTLVDIADSRKVTRSAISRQIKVLLGLEYIYQERDSNDRRRQYLRLTPRGDEIERVISKKRRNSGSKVGLTILVRVRRKKFYILFANLWMLPT